MASLSIALCTCNGSAYLEEQLASFAAQVRAPDELVVSDDCSQDKTLEIIQAFGSKVAFPVRLEVNEETLGVTKNFEKAISLCRGEIIVLSDQDDVWHQEKLMRTEVAFSDSPSVGAVFSDAEMVDENLNSLGYRLWQSLGFSASEQERVLRGKAVDVLLKHNVVAGATMAFRASFKDLALPIPALWLHDGWIALLVAIHADLSIIRQPLIRYRQHSRNQIGAVKKGLSETWRDATHAKLNPYATYTDQLKAVRERVLKQLDPPLSETLLKVESKILHLQVRGSLPARRLIRLPKVLRELITLRYFRFSNGTHSVVRDLFVS